IAAGHDMIRRLGLGPSWGRVWPLLVKADGRKFGKTEDGNVWLDPERTSPYAFHQFWLNAADADVRSLLLKFTLVDVGDVDALMRRHDRAPGARLAQRALADDVTTWVHGAEGCAAAQETGRLLFADDIESAALGRLAGQIPTVPVARDRLGAMTVE